MTSDLMVEDMQRLRCSNDALADRAELDRRWRDDGYLFFRRVIAPEAIEEAREEYRTVLSGRGLIDVDFKPMNIEAGGRIPLDELYERRVWQRLTSSESFARLVAGVLGEDPVWIPIAEYRATVPDPDPAGIVDPVAGRHQDGFFNDGIPFRICWIPLSPIDAEVGGLAVAAGMHKHGFLHDKDAPTMEIPADTIPPESWRRADYRPGDLLMFGPQTPHSGLNNRSRDTLRLSMDARFLASSAPRPAIGEVVAIEPGFITVRNEDGEDVTLTVDEHTYVRRFNRDVVPLSAYSPGERVMVPQQDGHATIIRPAK